MPREHLAQRPLDALNRAADQLQRLIILANRSSIGNHLERVSNVMIHFGNCGQALTYEVAPKPFIVGETVEEKARYDTGEQV